jgi:hypothetical protein
MSGHCLNQTICCVCDELFFCNEGKDFKFDINEDIDENPSEILHLMKTRLQVPTYTILNDILIDQYDCGEMYTEFKGLMLSGLGMKREENIVTITICNKCLKSLNRHKEDETYNKPPKFAISNGFYMGFLPLPDIPTFPENLMINLMSIGGIVKVIRGGHRKAIKGHVLMTKAIPAPPIHLLPRDIDPEVDFRVEFASCVTDEQKAIIRKLHETRRHVINTTLNWYMENNILYRSYAIDRPIIESIEVNSFNKTFKFPESDEGIHIYKLINIMFL